MTCSGRAQRCAAGKGTALVKYKVPQSPKLRIVDGDTHREYPQGLVGEIWVNGDNVAEGYWGKPPEEQRCFAATLADPSPGTPELRVRG
jgi:fatty acid CoA ligase FadD21